MATEHNQLTVRRLLAIALGVLALAVTATGCRETESMRERRLGGACPSPLMSKIAERADTARDDVRSVFDGDGKLTFDNRAAMDPAEENRQIWAQAGALIRQAQSQVLIQTYGFDSGGGSGGSTGSDGSTGSGGTGGNGGESAEEIFSALKDLDRSLRRAQPGLEDLEDACRVWDPSSATHPYQYESACTCKDDRPIDVLVLDDPGALLTSLNEDAQMQQLYDQFVAADVLWRPCLRIWLGMHSHGPTSTFHGKDVVVDGRAAVIGAGNVQNQFENEHGFCLEGEIACKLQSEFADSWSTQTTWYDLETGKKHERGYPVEKSCLPMAPTPLCADAPGVTEVLESDEQCLPMMVVTRNPNGNPDLLVPDNQNYTMNRAYLAAIKNAETSITISSPNLNDEDVLDALRDAVKRGVDVKILVPKGFNDAGFGDPLPGRTNEGAVEWLYDELNEHDGCQHLDIRWWRNAAGEVTDGNDGGATHDKYLSVDGQVAFVGSANMDFHTFDHAREVVVVVDNGQLVQQWDALVFDDVFANAQPVGQLADCDPCGRSVSADPGATDQASLQAGQSSECTAGSKLAEECSACTSAICAEMPECCSVEWSDSCVARVQTMTGACRGVCYDGKSSCPTSECTASEEPLSPSCSSCAASVCSRDEYCCEHKWDWVCAKDAKRDPYCHCE